MRHRWFGIFVAGLMLQACAKESVIQTPTMISVLTKDSAASTTAQELLRTESGRLTGNANLLEPVVRVSSRLIAAARRSEYGSRARNLCWVVAVYDDPAKPRAFVRPDGGIVVSIAIFRLAETEAGLAALLGHELAHALTSETVPGLPPCVSLGEQPNTLHTYEEELQADEIGLTLMAGAGYDPRELLRLWERLRLQEKVGDHVLEHFTYERRMEHIAQRLPPALMRYERANRPPQKKLPLK